MQRERENKQRCVSGIPLQPALISWSSQIRATAGARRRKTAGLAVFAREPYTCSWGRKSAGRCTAGLRTCWAVACLSCSWSAENRSRYCSYSAAWRMTGWQCRECHLVARQLAWRVRPVIIWFQAGAAVAGSVSLSCCACSRPCLQGGSWCRLPTSFRRRTRE